MQQVAIDFTAAVVARDAGIQRAADHAGEDWMSQAVEDFAAFLRARGEATLEQWRFDWLARGRPAPATHKAFGAVASSAARKGLVVNTGRYVRAVSPKTHAHPVPVWRAA